MVHVHAHVQVHVHVHVHAHVARAQQSLSIMKRRNIEVVPHSRCRKYDLAHSCPAEWVGGSSCWGQPDYLLQAAY